MLARGLLMAAKLTRYAFACTPEHSSAPHILSFSPRLDVLDLLRCPTRILLTSQFKHHVLVSDTGYSVGRCTFHMHHELFFRKSF